MSSDLQIQFKIGIRNYEVKFSTQKDSVNNTVLIGGRSYELMGDKDAIKLVKECLSQLPHDSSENLVQTGKELKARLWQAGAKDIKLATTEDVHKIGLKTLANVDVDIPQTINEICLSLEKFYVSPEVAKKCIDYLQHQLQEGVYESISDPETLAQVITADIRMISEDKHVLVDFNKRMPVLNLESSEPVEERYPTPQLTHVYAYKSTSEKGWMGATHSSFPYEIKSGYLEENPKVGYVDLRIFGVCTEKEPDARIAKAEKHLARLKEQRDHTKSGSAGRAKKRSLNEQIEAHEKRLEALKKADEIDLQKDVATRRKEIIAAIQNLKKAESVIIDLRNNGGGNPSAVQLMCSLFMEENFPLNRIEKRKGDSFETADFNTLTHKELEVDKRLLEPPVFVLIGPNTFSAAEEFSNNMKVLGRATIVGEPSGGGANPGELKKIGKDFTIFIPEGRAINPVQGGNWEGVGIIPDEVVPARDALDQALNLINEK